MEYYKSEKISEHMTAIHSLSGEIMYLIEGSQSAVLMDTCVGVGHLKQYVEGLTHLPITVLLSHGHIDHAMGAPEFEDVYMNHLDTDIYDEMSDIQGRKAYIDQCLGYDSKLEEKDFVPPSAMTFKDLQEGMVFDLGGVHVEVYAFPGHTPGTMIFNIPEEEGLILGDACNKSTFLFDERCSSVKEYQKTVRKIDAMFEGRLQHIYCCHRTLEFPVTLMKEMVELCDNIMAGNCDDIPFSFMGKNNACIAKAVDQEMNRLDGKTANLIYNKNKII